MCAGSIHTPQIMQLSGFGPRDQLSEMGVDVKADLPGVGQNMIVSVPMCISGSSRLCMGNVLTVTASFAFRACYIFCCPAVLCKVRHESLCVV